MRVSIVTGFFRFIYKNRIVALLVSCVLGILSGILVSNFGRYLPARPKQAIAGIARIHRVVPPEGGRKLADVGTLTVRMDGADDYGRVFVNNYLVMNNELASLIGEADLDKDRLSEICKYSVDRRNPPPGEKDVTAFLKKGKNYLIFEVENSMWGTCGTSVDMKINEIRLQGFPLHMPEDFNVEKASANEKLLFSLKSISPDVALEDALCARRIVELELD